MSLFCVNCTHSIPPQRLNRKGMARFCCSDSCYAALRRFLRSWKRKTHQNTFGEQEATLRSAQVVSEQSN